MNKILPLIAIIALAHAILTPELYRYGTVPMVFNKTSTQGLISKSKAAPLKEPDYYLKYVDDLRTFMITNGDPSLLALAERYMTAHNYVFYTLIAAFQKFDAGPDFFIFFYVTDKGLLRL